MIFGTDGVRGIVDKDINCKLAFDIGKGMAQYLNSLKSNNKVIIGCDTRLSSDTYMMTVAGALSDNGVDVHIVGVVSTPMISFFVSKFNYDGGVMITASHNDFTYNGIKLFNTNGEKLNKSEEIRVEKLALHSTMQISKKGRIIYNEGIVNDYINYVVNNVNCDLSKMTIAIDCANGSNYKIAPYVFKKLGANVICCSCNNDGENINKDCGANHIYTLCNEVKLHNADFGIAFDGDGDRLRIVLNDGRVLSGDHILLIIALYLKKTYFLNNLIVAGTILTNMGLEKKLNENNITLIRSCVGDKNVIQLMKKNSLSLGGEPSGHICILNHIPSCDALYNALFFLKCCENLDINLNEVINDTMIYPSLSKNINIKNNLNFDLKSNRFKYQFNKIKKLYSDYKIIIRPSGTEPVLRIYVEGKDLKIIENIIIDIENIIKNKHS